MFSYFSSIPDFTFENGENTEKMTKKEKDDLKKEFKNFLNVSLNVLRRKVRRAKTKETRGKSYDNSMQKRYSTRIDRYWTETR